MTDDRREQAAREQYDISPKENTVQTDVSGWEKRVADGISIDVPVEARGLGIEGIYTGSYSVIY